MRIPAATEEDPVRSIVDGLTVVHMRGGTPAVEAVLEAVMEALYEKGA